MTAQQTAARPRVPTYAEGWEDGRKNGIRAERERIRKELLAVGVIQDDNVVLLWRDKVIAAIKKATRAPRAKR